MFEHRTISSDTGDIELNILMKNGKPTSPSLKIMRGNVEVFYADNASYLRELIDILEDYLAGITKTEMEDAIKSGFPYEMKKVQEIYDILLVSSHIGYLND